jgi:predicted nucleotidyltransferase
MTSNEVFAMKEPQSLTEILAILRLQKHVLQTQFGVLDLAVFGSYVNHTQIQASDVDLFVDLKPEYKTFDNYMELRFFLEEQLQKKIDLAIKESIREELKADIFNEAVYV